MDKFPRWLQFKVLSNLNVSDLCSMREAGKYWYYVIATKEFWTFKMREETGQTYHVDLPMSGKIWYERQSRAGQLYFVKDLTFEVDSCTLEDVYLYRYCNGCHYYVDVAGNLYYKNDDDTDRITSHYDFCILSDDYDGSEECLGIAYLNQTSESGLVKVKQISNVKNIIPTNIGDLILTLDYKLYTIGKFSNQFPFELIFTRENVKSIGGCNIMCFYLTFAGELWIYRPADGEIVPELVATDVKSACTLFESHNVLDQDGCVLVRIWYLSKDNKLYVKYFDRVRNLVVNFGDNQPQTLFSVGNMLWMTNKHQMSFPVRNFLQMDYDFQEPDFKSPHNSYPPASCGKLTRSAFVYPLGDDGIYRQNQGKLALYVWMKDATYMRICLDVGRITNVFEADKIYVVSQSNNLNRHLY